jgi:NADH-quinone oxidoreductase subunit J
VVSANNTQALGYLMFTDYLYAFEIAGIILLVAIIAAVALTLRKRKDVKGQNIAEQVAVKAKDRMRIVSMDSSNEAKQDRKSKSSETESKS